MKLHECKGGTKFKLLETRFPPVCWSEVEVVKEGNGELYFD